MSSYYDLYKEKLTTPEAAAALVKSGDWLDYGWCTSHSYDFDRALANNLDHLRDVKVRGGVALWTPEIIKADPTGEHVAWHSWHSTGADRKAIQNGGAAFIPVKYSEILRLYRENVEPIDIMVFQVTPMDKHGYFNFGPNASHTQAILERSRTVIVEINEHLPFCYGTRENFIHISDVDYIIEGTQGKIAAMPAGTFDDVDMAVAKIITDEIRDGDCLQLGIGGMPNAIGSLLAESDLKDLGIHSEFYVDAFVDLSEKGIVTGRYKPLDPYTQVYAFAAGTQRLYDFLDQNPACVTKTVDYVNGISSISKIPNFVSINNAINVDLFGQAASETAGFKHISGAGGQLDFVLGAYASPGGRTYMCLSSTFTKRDGTMVSRIVPTLPTGSIVTDTRANAQFIVTEYGKFNCKGKSTWERTEGLINIAHPDFRDELIESAEKLGLWRPSNKR